MAVRSRQRRMHILGGGWTPASLGGLSAWYDSQDYSTLYQDSALTTPAGNGDVIGGWTDKSGNGYTLTQATTANKPTMTASAINGIAALRLDGTNDVLTSSLAQPGIFTLFVVGANRTGDNGSFWSSDAGALAAVLQREAAPDSQHWLDAGGALITVALSSINTDLIAVYAFDYTNDNYSVWVNRVSATSAVAIANPGGNMCLGARNADREFLNGDIGEVIIVNRILTSGEIATTETYLANRWGMTLP